MDDQGKAAASPVSRPVRLWRQVAEVMFPRPMPDDRQNAVSGWSTNAPIVIVLALVGVLYLASYHNYGFIRRHYLLFHSLAELFSVAVAWGIFAVVWHSRQRLDNNYLLLIGVAYLFVGTLDLVHTLAYKGMGVFSGQGTNLAAQLWISARYLEGLSLLIAPVFLRRRVRAGVLLAVYGAVSAAALVCIFYLHVFPTCFVEPAAAAGQKAGLTTFKIGSEYLICLMLAAAAALLIRNRKRFDPIVVPMLIWSIAVTIAAEMAFTLYSDAYGPANIIGHFFKIVSFYFIYGAIVRTGLVRPQAILYRDLQQSQQALRGARDELEKRVADRTAELVNVNERLLREIDQRKDAQGQVNAERRRLLSLLHMLPGYVSLHGQDYRIRLANHRFLRYFGAPGDRPCHQVLRGRDQPCEACPMIHVLRSQRPADWEWTSPAGRTYHVWAYPFADVDGTSLVLELGIDVTDRKHLEKEVLAVSEAERQRIGQDLHDTLGQDLTGAAFLAKVLGEGLSARRAPEAADAARIEAMLNDAVAEARSVAKGLCPVRLDRGGLVPALAELASTTEKIYGVSCTFEYDDSAAPADAIVAAHLYRIVQEALNNAMRHSKARNVRIALTGRNHRVYLAVHDDGVGLPENLDESKGMGLRIIRHRAGAIGAALHITSRPGRGTTVACSVSTPTQDEGPEHQ